VGRGRVLDDSEGRPPDAVGYGDTWPGYDEEERAFVLKLECKL